MASQAQDDRRSGKRGESRGSLGSWICRELRIYRFVLKHERTPWLTRVLLGAALGYAASPIDLIPDWFPVVGHLDDIVIVPLLVWLALRFVPSCVVAECRELARGGKEGSGGEQPRRA